MFHRVHHRNIVISKFCAHFFRPFDLPSTRFGVRLVISASCQGSSEKQKTAQRFLIFWSWRKLRPEVVCFLTELALASEDVQMGGQNFFGGMIRGVFDVLLNEFLLDFYGFLQKFWVIWM